jgi:hypothetical protein
MALPRGLRPRRAAALLLLLPLPLPLPRLPPLLLLLLLLRLPVSRCSLPLRKRWQLSPRMPVPGVRLLCCLNDIHASTLTHGVTMTSADATFSKGKTHACGAAGCASPLSRAFVAPGVSSSSSDCDAISGGIVMNFCLQVAQHSQLCALRLKATHLGGSSQGTPAAYLAELHEELLAVSDDLAGRLLALLLGRPRIQRLEKAYVSTIKHLALPTA